MRLQLHIRAHAPEITVERAVAPVERSRARPRKVIEVEKAATPTVLETERRVIIRDEEQAEAKEVPDVLADQRAMQCSDWAHEQDADPVLKHLKALLKEFGSVAPNNAQLISELVEVKSLCQHWNLLELVNDVATRVMKDLTGQVTYARLVPADMCVELFKLVHGQDAGHFGYAKIYLLFSERFFWHGMSTDIRNWLTCYELCQRIKPGPGKARYALVQEIAGAERCGVDLSGPWPLSKEGN